MMMRIAFLIIPSVAVLLPLCALAQSRSSSGAALVTVETRDFKVMFNEKAAWTLYEISYKGTVVCGHNGYYGAVLIPKGGKFIGTGHTDGGQEQVEKVELTVDGVKRPLTDKAIYKGHKIVLKKNSMIDKLKHTATLEITDDQIREHHDFTATEDEAMHLMYAFMHPWVPTTKYWIGMPLQGGDLLRGEFANDKGFKMRADVRWTAVYDPTNKNGMVAAYPKPIAGKLHKNAYWDQPHYHKLYFQTFSDDTVKAGTAWDYEIVLRGFEATEKEWEKKATSVAAAAIR